MENLSPPSPPNQRWENGAFWLLLELVLDLGGGYGDLLFHFISSKIVAYQHCYLFTIICLILFLT